MGRRSLLPIFVVAAAVATGLASSHITAQEPHGFARRDTVPTYSDSQATVGAAVFAKNCSECHEGKAMSSADFRTKWGGQPLFTLFEQIRTTMPDGNPGSLTREQYTAALAYILKLNGLPAGPSALATDSASLAAVKLVLPAS